MYPLSRVLTSNRPRSPEQKTQPSNPRSPACSRSENSTAIKLGPNSIYMRRCRNYSESVTMPYLFHLMPRPLDLDPQTHIFECRAQDYLNALDPDLENRAEPKEAKPRFVVRSPEEWNRLPLDLKNKVRTTFFLALETVLPVKLIGVRLANRWTCRHQRSIFSSALTLRILPQSRPHTTIATHCHPATHCHRKPTCTSSRSPRLVISHQTRAP